MVVLLLLGATACGAGAVFVGLRLRGSPCVGAAIGMSLYIGWSAAVYVLARWGIPDLPVQRLFLVLYVVIPLPVAVLGLLAVVSQQRRRLLLTLASAFSLPLVLPMMLFVARWWIETGPMLFVFVPIPAIVFLCEAHGTQVFGENPFRP